MTITEKVVHETDLYRANTALANRLIEASSRLGFNHRVMVARAKPQWAEHYVQIDLNPEEKKALFNMEVQICDERGI